MLTRKRKVKKKKKKKREKKKKKKWTSKKKKDTQMALDARLQDIDENLADYEMLLQSLKAAQASETILVDLGQAVFCRSKPKSALVNIHTGLGFFVEMEQAEAQAFVQKKITFLKEERSLLQQPASRT